MTDRIGANWKERKVPKKYWGKWPCAFCQQPIWFLYKADPSSGDKDHPLVHRIHISDQECIEALGTTVARLTSQIVVLERR